MTKDIIFTIYRYKIDKLPAVQTELFTDGRKLNSKDYATNELFFESFLPEKGKTLDLWGESKRKSNNVETSEKDSHVNLILEKKDHIVILALQANKTKKIDDENWENHPVPHHPSCRVIFDHQIGHQFVAIERTAMDTDESANILQNSFNYQLNKFGLRFEIVRLKRTLPFLEAVYDIKNKLNDNVTKVVFDFDNNIEQSKKVDSKFVHALSEWIGKFADTGQVSANISNDEQLKNDIIRQDFELMADLCSSNNHYNLLVRFQHFGLFRYGYDVKAQFGVEAGVLNCFVSPTEENSQMLIFEEDIKEPQITLPEWLNHVSRLYKDYEEEALSVPKRTRRNKRRI